MFAKRPHCNIGHENGSHIVNSTTWMASGVGFLIDNRPAGVMLSGGTAQTRALDQKVSRNENCISLGLFKVLFMEPNPGEPTWLAGGPNWVRLNALRNSVSKIARTRSVIWVSFAIAISQLLTRSPAIVNPPYLHCQN